MTTLTAPPAPPTDSLLFKPEPLSVANLGLDRGVVRDLTLKTLYYRGRMTRTALADELRLSQPVMEEVMANLSQEGFVTVLGSEGSGAAAYTYSATQKGIERAEAAIARSGYVGPAPVPLADYVAQARAQTVVDAEVTREQVLDALGELVLAGETVARIGRAASSRKPTLIYGASGNGKTTAVRALGTVVGGTLLIPYAFEVVGQIVKVFDASKHVRVPEVDDDVDVLRARPDRRWVRIERPVIWAGGELTRHSLELVYDDETKVYEAPLQLKANGGTLIIDDFGRQQMPAVQLLNRWIVALEGGLDHLTMHTGQTIEVPFDVLVLFSTNLPPDRLADEAFLRRIRYKVLAVSPTRDEFLQIFEGCCRERELPFDRDVAEHLVEKEIVARNVALRGCQPRDLIDQAMAIAAYESQPRRLTKELVSAACLSYFVEDEDLATA